VQSYSALVPSGVASVVFREECVSARYSWSSASRYLSSLVPPPAFLWNSSGVSAPRWCSVYPTHALPGWPSYSCMVGTGCPNGLGLVFVEVSFPMARAALEVSSRERWASYSVVPLGQELPRGPRESQRWELDLHYPPFSHRSCSWRSLGEYSCRQRSSDTKKCDVLL